MYEVGSGTSMFVAELPPEASYHAIDCISHSPGVYYLKPLPHPTQGRIMSGRTVICFLFILCFTSTGLTQEQSLKKKDVPRAVLEAFQKAYPKATVKGFSREVEEGKVLYEVESVEGKIHRDISYNPDGSVITLEETLPVSELPEAVRSSMKTDYPQATITRCEKVTEGQTVKYELAIHSGQTKSEVVFDAEGKILKTEKK
jgi:hypothetical protein